MPGVMVALHTYPLALERLASPEAQFDGARRASAENHWIQVCGLSAQIHSHTGDPGNERVDISEGRGSLSPSVTRFIVHLFVE